jgi:hypothetical protein
MRPLDRSGKDRVAGNSIGPTGDGNLFTPQQAFDILAALVSGMRLAGHDHLKRILLRKVLRD